MYVYNAIPLGEIGLEDPEPIGELIEFKVKDQHVCMIVRDKLRNLLFLSMPVGSQMYYIF